MSKKILNLQQLLRKITKQCQLSPTLSTEQQPQSTTTATQQDHHLLLQNPSWGEYLHQIQLILQQHDDDSYQMNQFIHSLLMELQQKKQNSQIQKTILRISNYFFYLFLHFRQQLCQQLKEFTTSILPLSKENLPRSEIQNYLLRILAEWDYDFGQFHPQLRAFTRYLKESLKLFLPNISVRVLMMIFSSLF